MEVFVRVAECGSFSRAAESLDLANATVTICVRNLERHLNVTLINRDTRRLKLTEEGLMYLPRARELLQAVAQTEENVRSLGGELHGPLHIESPISLGQALICPVLPAFARRFPGITTSISMTNQPHNMIERAIDVAIRMGYVEDADLVAKPLRECRYVVCCAPDLAKTLPAHPRDLDPRQCLGILPEGRHLPNRWKLEKDGEHLELHPTGPLQFNSSDSLLTAAATGIGVAHVLDIYVDRILDSGALVQVYGDWATPTKTVYVVTAKDQTASAKVRAFTDFLFEIVESRRRPTAHRPVLVRALGKR